MKLLNSVGYVKIPAGVKIEIKSRKVTVTGKRGTLSCDLTHQAVEIRQVNKGLIRIDKWFGTKREIACVRTFCSKIENMITGVTKGYRYKMRLVYAHFPINVNIDNNTLEIRNYIGEKVVKRIKMIGSDTKITKSTDVKDQLVIEGNDVNSVSQTCAQIQQSCRPKGKDIRKFLDGIYVSEKGAIKDA